MRRRPLGTTDLELPAVVFGAYALGGGHWGAVDDAEAERAVRAALDVGMNAFDTAPVYGFGHSEEVLGRALGARRDEALLLTKVGLRWDGDRGVDGFTMPGRDGEPRAVDRDSRPESVRLEVERSLARLRTDRLDLVQVHARDPRTPIAETLGALAQLRAEGKLRAIGVSNYSVAELDEARRALGDVPLASTQSHYSLVERGLEADVLPWAREHGVGLVAYAPLAQGLLTGRVRADRTFGPGDARGANPRFSAANRERVNARLDAAVAPAAAAHGATLAQAVVAWTVDRPGVTACLVGARTEAQVRENAVAGALELTADEAAAIEAAFRGPVLELPRPSLVARLRGRLRRALGRG